MSAMSLGLQDVLALLATNASLRERFQREGVGALSEFSLNSRARDALAALPLVALERFARSLISKRWDDVAKVIPLTLRISRRIESRYRVWVRAHPALAEDTVLAPGVQEAHRALPFLRHALSNDEGEVVFVAELLAFEVLRACSRGDGSLRHLRARHHVVSIAEDLRRGLLPIDPERDAYEFRFEGAAVHWRKIS